MMRRENFKQEKQHIHAPIHVVDAPRLDDTDEIKDDEVVSFIDKCISCSMPNEKVHPNSFIFI